MKTLIVYYSLEGNTRKAAENLAGKLQADLLRLVPVQDIPDKGFKKFLLGGKEATAGKGTTLKAFDQDPGRYDRILLGTPVWAGKPAPAINEFLKTAEKEKILGVFTLSLSGDHKKCVQILRRQCPNLKVGAALFDERNQKLSENNEKKMSRLAQKFERL